MRIGGMRQWRRVSRRLKKYLASQALILMYHRVADLPSDPQLLGVTPQHFAEQLALLQKHYHPLPLAHLVASLRQGKAPRGAVVITFDDGYADNLHNARPLLAAHDIPATVFVTAGHIGQAREFWWDELDRVILRPGTLPPALRLNIDGMSHTWELGEAAAYTNEDYRRYRDWHIERPDDPGPRQRLYRSLYHHLHSLSPEARESAVADLLAWAGVTATGRPSHRPLTPEEVIELGKDGLIEIGAHTMTHPLLASLSLPAQRQEIQQSKAHLESLLNRPVLSFAYPHGSKTAETVAILRQTGFVCACSSRDEAVWRGDDCFQLPRVVVRDWDGETFARWLKEWLGD